MVTLSRKKREILEREVQILRLARPILLKEGYQALSMERLASLMEYAKGTLYNHFPNKEEIVLALALESIELRFKLFEAANKMGGISGDRCCV
jgi:AcrR family transcriptional regulator